LHDWVRARGFGTGGEGSGMRSGFRDSIRAHGGGVNSETWGAGEGQHHAQDSKRTRCSAHQSECRPGGPNGALKSILCPARPTKASVGPEGRTERSNQSSARLSPPKRVSARRAERSAQTNSAQELPPHATHLIEHHPETHRSRRRRELAVQHLPHGPAGSVSGGVDPMARTEPQSVERDATEQPA